MTQDFTCQVSYLATSGLSSFEMLGLTMVLGGVIVGSVLIGRMAAAYFTRAHTPVTSQ
jgi:hypothetical protein